MSKLSPEIEVQVVFVKERWVALDSQLQLMKGARPSREMSLAITKLQECIMWLGMNFQELGTANPHPNSYVVDPTADGLKL